MVNSQADATADARQSWSSDPCGYLPQSNQANQASCASEVSQASTDGLHSHAGRPNHEVYLAELRQAQEDLKIVVAQSFQRQEFIAQRLSKVLDAWEEGGSESARLGSALQAVEMKDSAPALLRSATSSDGEPSPRISAGRGRATTRNSTRNLEGVGSQTSSFSQFASAGHIYNTKSAALVQIEKGPEVLLRTYTWLHNLHEPTREGFLADVIKSSQFETLCGFVILLNAVFTIVVANYELRELEDQTALMDILETVFGVFYFTEIALKLMVHRLYFFANEDKLQNIFDISLVAIDALTQILSLWAQSGFIEVSFLRSTRILKITKVLRVLRVSQVFSELRLLLHTLKGSVSSVAWCGVVIVFTLILFALLFCQIIAGYLLVHIANDTCDQVPGGDCTNNDLLVYFGSTQSAMLSLYMATTGGRDWHFYHDLVLQVGDATGSAFVVFTFVYEFGMFNLLTSMFVDRTMKCSKPDMDSLITAQREKERGQTAALKAVFSQLDADGNGMLSHAELQELLKTTQVSHYLAALGLEIKDAEMFFHVLMDITDQEEVPINEFVQGCMRMQGFATSIDMQALHFEVRVLMDQVIEMREALLSPGPAPCLQRQDQRPAQNGGFIPPLRGIRWRDGDTYTHDVRQAQV